MTVMVLGARGQLGQALVDRLREGAKATVCDFGHAQVDVTDEYAVSNAMQRVEPDVVVNCSAFTDVDAAESRQDEALKVNGLAVGVLARAAQASGAIFVHFSSDFVFAGREERQWHETDVPEPQSVYAQSKLIGEWLARDCSSNYVLRVESLFGGPRPKSTLDRIVETLRAGREVRLFRDRTVSPSFVNDVVDATWALVARRAEPGVYHCVNSGTTTWLGVGQAVARMLDLDARLLVPTSVADVPMKAARPQFAALSNAKLIGAGVLMPTWQDGLGRYLAGSFPAGRAV